MKNKDVCDVQQDTEQRALNYVNNNTIGTVVYSKIK